TLKRRPPPASGLASNRRFVAALQPSWPTEAGDWIHDEAHQMPSIDRTFDAYHYRAKVRALRPKALLRGLRAGMMLDKVLDAVERLRPEMLSSLSDIVRIPSINPRYPGESYEERV